MYIRSAFCILALCVYVIDLCVIDETLVDTNCYMEGAGEYSLGAAGTCDAKCLTETKLEKECFTSIDIDV